MKPNYSTANRTSVRVKSSPRSLRSAAASRGNETLCRPSLPTAEASPAACAAPAKWCGDSTPCAPAAVNGSPATAMDAPAAVDATLASAASANASTGAAVQTPTPAAADVAPAAMTASGNEPFAAPARPFATADAAAKKPAAADAAPAPMTTSGNEPFATSARASANLCATTKKPAAATGALSAERRAAAVAAGVVLRSADDRTALFTQWLAPHLPMVRGLVRRHTYFAGERADDYQTAVLHLLEHLDDLAHFALCLTARRDTAKPHAATANDPAPADEPSAQPTTPVARDFDETRAAVDESEIYLDEHTPYLYASTAESNESRCGGDETRPASDETLREVDETPPSADEALRAIDAAAVAFDAMTDADDEALREVDGTQREVDETQPADDEDLCAIDAAAMAFDAMTDADNESQCGGDETQREVDETAADADEALRAIDTAAVGFDAMTDTDDEDLHEVNETRREVDETQPTADKESLRGDDETAAGDEASAAAEDERQPYADAALEGSEQTPAPLPVTAEEVLRTVGDFNPRPWLAGVTLRLLSTLNHRALRHRETHLTPASVDSDELFDPVDPDGDLWSAGADPATVGAQRHTAPSRWEETLGAGRERTGGSAGVSTRDATATRAAQAVAAHSATAVSRSATAAPDAPPAGTEAAAAAEGGPTAAGEWACSAVDNCLECWHREQPRRGFHRTRGGRLWNAMRARAQQAHSAFAYRAVLRADAAEALAAQPLRDRALVLLTADGWTAEEIGLAVGASPTAVRQTVCRVRMRLRRWRRAWAHRTHATRAL